MKQSILLLTILLSVACNNTANSNQRTNNVSKNDSIAKLLETQLLKGAYAENDITDVPIGYTFTENDIDLICPIIRDSLLKKGYLLDDSLFPQKLKNIFGKQITENVRYNFVDYDNCPYPVTWEYFQFNEEQFLICPQYQLVISLLMLPELIDYQKEYPEIAKKEDTISTAYVDYEGAKRTLWKDIRDLDSRRKKNWNLLFHRNKYLFNDSQTSLTWLMKNDAPFLTSLLKVFGFDKEERINQMVLSKAGKEFFSTNDPLDNNNFVCDYLFFRQDCNGKLVINRSLF